MIRFLFCLAVFFSMAFGAQEGEISPIAAAPLVWKDAPLADYGISTTLEEGRGNWYVKKQQVKAALELKKQIDSFLGTIADRRTALDEIQALVEGQVAQFFSKVGFAPGELDERLTLLVQDIEKSSGKMGLTEQNRAIIAEAEAHKKDIAALKADLDLLKRLVDTVIEAVRVAIAEIGKSERFRQESVSTYDAIDETISDERAERLLATMRAQNETLEAIDRYVSVDLPQYCQQTIVSIGQTIVVIEKKIADFKSKGLSLEKKVQEEKKKQPDLKNQPVQQVPWYKRWYREFFAMIWNFIVSIFRLIGIKFD